MIKHKHMTPLQKAKAIVKMHNKGWVNNHNEYKKGFKRGQKDSMSGKPFGHTCHKLTRSVTAGYVSGWRYKRFSARIINKYGIRS